MAFFCFRDTGRRAMSTYQFVAGDTGSKLEVTCINDDTGAVINLTGSTVKLKWKNTAGVLQIKTMTITSAVGGVAEYQFLTGELFSGTMNFEVEITDSSSKIIRSLDLISEKVRRAL